MNRLEKAALVLVILGLIAGAGCASWLSNGDGDPLPPVTINHHSPNISAISATPSSIVPNGTINLVVTAADADGDTLTYAWTGTGTFGTASAATTTWTHGTVGQYSLTCTVSDGALSTTGVVSVIVAQPQPPGPTNDAPVPDPDGMSTDVSAPVAGQKVIFAMAFTDPNSDALSVNWDDGSGSGNFSDISFDAATGIAKATWTAPAAGNYTITATADDGKAAAADKLVFVTASASLGVTVAAMPTSFDFVGYATCIGCHSDKGDETAGTGWFSTNHSDAIQRNLSDPANTHAYRNEGCYACHALGKEPNDSGQGFIDMALTPQFANIQCESCHGGGNPAGMGAGHKTQVWNPLTGMVYVAAEDTWAPDASFDSSNGVGCGACHEGSRHGAVEEWAKSWHANFENTEEDEANPGVMIPNHKLTGASCAKCHNGQEFVRVHIDGEPAEDVALTLEDLPNVYIGCATCHDPHEASNEKQLRVSNTDTVIIPWDDTPVNGGWGNICIECHDGRRTRANYDTQVVDGSSHFGPHGNPQGAMFFGLMGADLGAPTTYDSDHPHKAWNENTCISCHMYRRDYISSSEPALWGHEFEPRFEQCITCHSNYTIDDGDAFWAWVEDYQTNEIHALMTAFVDAWPAEWKDVTDPANPELTSVESAPGAGDGPPAADPTGNGYREALWNYELVINDATHGVHNPTYTKDLLNKATARVNELNALP